jgi:hypothetical protein
MGRETFRFFVSASVLGDEPPGSKSVRRQCEILGICPHGVSKLPLVEDRHSTHVKK